MTDNINWQTRTLYMLVIILMLLSSVCFGQIKVVQYNASWNKANDVPWVMDLKDCKTIGYTDIAKQTKAQAKYKIAVVPTIIIFKDGEEIKRYQADLSFKLLATRKEIQGFINEQIMSDF